METEHPPYKSVPTAVPRTAENESVLVKHMPLSPSTGTEPFAREVWSDFRPYAKCLLVDFLISGLLYLLQELFDLIMRVAPLQGWPAVVGAVAPSLLGGRRSEHPELRANGKRRRGRYVIVGVTETALALRARLPKDDFAGFFDYREAARLAGLVPPGEQLSRLEQLVGFVRAHGVTAVYVTAPASGTLRFNEVVADLQDTTTSIYVVPDVAPYGLAGAPGQVVDINGIAALSLFETPFRGGHAVSKRLTDIVVSFLVLVLSAPVILIVALGVRLTSPGPIIFKQRRYGLDGREFLVYKFRTMTVGEDGAAILQASRNDARVTPIGRSLRRYSLDELPQLLNVLQGSMSLVGPRPHTALQNDLYRNLTRKYMFRHHVRPGITGLAQIRGMSSETMEQVQQAVDSDVDYVRNWSMLLDIRILIRSVVSLFSPGRWRRQRSV